MFQAWIIERERGENSENCVAFGSFVYRLPCTISSLLFFYLEDKKSFCLISHTSFAVHPFCNLLVDATVVECLLVNYKRVNWGCLRCNWILLFLSSTFTCGDFARMTAGEKFISSNILWWNSAIDESNIKQTAFHSENRFFFSVTFGLSTFSLVNVPSWVTECDESDSWSVPMSIFRWKFVALQNLLTKCLTKDLGNEKTNPLCQLNDFQPPAMTGRCGKRR